ncbi:glycosyltransferase family 9 protein [uncultured Sulfurimonas sp.]|uniref:glycosyltransferase family 9 protein n=1 Tax=uncultured Sulfurimonas sp. TaxID=291845 RepID=UPI0032B1CBAE
MIFYVSLLALGDNLISLSLLDQLDSKEINILGTKHTKNIANLIENEDKFNIQEIFEDIPAFYDIKKQGIISAAKDLYFFIYYIRSNNVKELVFEKKDFRSNLVSFFTNAHIYYPNKLFSNVYENRKNIIETIYKHKLINNEYELKVIKPKIILINPTTRIKEKNIRKEDLFIILNELNKCNYKIYLIDIENKYKQFEKDVDIYLSSTTLDDVKELILISDLYIGADSFLIHLAYYLKRNYFILFYKDNEYFLPPNVQKDFYLKITKELNIRNEIIHKFTNIGLIK